MDFGVVIFPTEYTIRPDEIARALEERGFESVWFPEHTHIPASRRSPWPGGAALPKEYWHSYDPFVALTAAAPAGHHGRRRAEDVRSRHRVRQRVDADLTSRSESRREDPGAPPAGREGGARSEVDLDQPLLRQARQGRARRAQDGRRRSRDLRPALGGSRRDPAEARRLRPAHPLSFPAT